MSAPTGIATLIARIDHQRAALDADQRKLAALRAFVGFADGVTAMERIETLLNENRGMVFTAGEIMEACTVKDEAGRKALTRALQAGRIRRVSRGCYCAPAGEDAP